MWCGEIGANVDNGVFKVTTNRRSCLEDLHAAEEVCKRTPKMA